MNKTRHKAIKKVNNPNEWDDFRDIFQSELYENQGIAQLGRWYIKNNYFIYNHIPHDESDKTIKPIPIVAIGITAFLAADNYGSFQYAAISKGWNAGKGSQIFFHSYYEKCMEFLKSNERNRTIFESDWKSEMELAQDHCRYEERILSQRQWYYDEVNDTNQSAIEIINKAALKYLDWVKENKITKDEPHKGLVSKPTIPQIALRYVFEGKVITRINADQIAKENGYRSGEKLYQEFTLFSNNNDRKARPTKSSKVTLRNKIRLFEIVIEMLPESKKSRAQDELNILNSFYTYDYQ